VLDSMLLTCGSTQLQAENEHDDRKWAAAARCELRTEEMFKPGACYTSHGAVVD
jgi:hypothetical protein